MNQIKIGDFVITPNGTGEVIDYVPSLDPEHMASVVFVKLDGSNCAYPEWDNQCTLLEQPL